MWPGILVYTAVPVEKFIEGLKQKPGSGRVSL